MQTASAIIHAREVSDSEAASLKPVQHLLRCVYEHFGNKDKSEKCLDKDEEGLNRHYSYHLPNGE